MSDFKKATEKVIEFFQQEVAGLRTGRANAAIVDGVMVESYGTNVPLKQVASITVPDATTIVLTPWDKSLLGAIESSLQALDLGAQPVNDGMTIRIVLPPMTEERRTELTKVVGEKLEAARVALRNLRHEAIESAEKEGLPEDALKHEKDELTKLTTEVNAQLEALAAEKKQELLKL
jgi:ribosome recycling factor